MPRLTIDKKATALGALQEGMSLRGTGRLTGISLPRLCRLVLEAGQAADRLLDEHVRNVQSKFLEADEQWMYVQKRRHRVRPDDPPTVGDTWVWTGVDVDSKVIVAHHVGKRQIADAQAFGAKLRERVKGQPQISTDRLHAYRAAILGSFSEWNGESWDRPSWGTIVKHFKSPEIRDQGRYVPPRMAKVERRIESGNPDVSRISTSHVEAAHLQHRMRNRRAARMTNAASKSLRHLEASVSSYVLAHNFIRKHSTIKTTPAVAAGLADRPWTLMEFTEAVELYGRV